MKQYKILLTSFSLFCMSVVFGQIAVTNTQTPNQLVQNVLIGAGVTASNITFNTTTANANAIQPSAGYFNANGTAFPLYAGVVLSTGNVTALPGVASAFASQDLSGGSDPDLAAIEPAGIHDAAVLEFDFVATGDSVRFNYIFGSEEYPEFVNSGYNDAFGFFLSGPGIAGPYANGAINIALVPGTSTPVTIDNVNSGSNSAYYQDNSTNPFGTTTVLDAFTTVLAAEAQIQCGQTYHIKIAIGDAGDGIYDSAVFLEANSFSSDMVQVAVATVSGDTTVVEGCTTADLMFIRPANQINDSLVINYTISGTAQDGVDFPALPNPITFVPGVDTVILTIDPIADGIPDNMEYITITVQTVTVCGDTITSTGTLYISDSVNIDINEPDPTVYCINDSVEAVVSATGGTAPYVYTWSTGVVNDTAYLSTVTGSMTGVIDYYVTATDACNYSNTDTVTVTLNQTLQVDTTISYPSSACNPTGAVSAFVSGQTGAPYYHWTGPGNPGSFNIDATVMQNIPPGWYYFTVVDDVCNASDSVYVDVENPPIANLSANINYGCAPLTVTFTNSSQNTNTYYWDFGNGNSYNVNDLSSQTETFLSGSTVMLVAFADPTCSDTAYVNIGVDPCGCTDPNATNYNSIATIDDGSCVYPTPVVTAPNVFTPNGDNDNDLFVLSHINTVDIQLVIVNRWGNVMYEGSGPNPVWDGKEGNNEAVEGTYFYKFIATGYSGEEVTGHGFVELIRD